VNYDLKPYIYPQLCDIDLYITRVGALGLGNMLFPYSRALIAARDTGAQLIKPTWGSIPIGPILRREKDKRAYRNLFTYRQTNVPVIKGLERLKLLLFHKGDIEVFHGMEGEFTPILGKENAAYIREHLCSILQERNKRALEFNPKDGICLHVRLGDFTRGTEEEIKAGLDNASTPIQWYVDRIKEIREACGRELQVYLFSDGSDEELFPILDLPHVKRMSFGTAIADILALSNARLLLASGSTFSRWARYLGRVNTICYPTQLKMKLTDPEEGILEEEAEQIDDAMAARIRVLFDR